jgi:hypothetical protein
MDRARRNRVILLSLLILGVALRVRQYAACPSYWYDEAYLLRNVFHQSFTQLLGPLGDDQAAPPLFLGMLRSLYRLAGGGEGWMRLPALAASVAGLFVMVPLARSVAGRRGAVWAVALCALGHHAAAHAGEVKPYTLDFLLTELILLAALRCQSIVTRWRSWVALGLLAVFAPWASYPAVFVLGGVSTALLVDVLRRRERTRAILAALMTGLFVLSSLVLWCTVARHQATPGLRAFWASSFLDLSSPGAAAAWTGRCLIEIGNYGTREMGLPLLVLAAVGTASRGRRSLMLIGPFVLALAASALQRYPLGGRLLFFLTPCVWLLAARGIAVLVQRLPVHRRVYFLSPSPLVGEGVGAGNAIFWGLIRLLPIVLLIPAALWAGRLFIAVTPRCQFREGFAHVEAHRQPGDVLWVSHPQVYEVYYGRPPDLDAYSPPEVVEGAARTGRLWMVCAVAGERLTAADMVARVRAAPCLVLERRRFKGLEVVLYAPIPNEESSSSPRLGTR